MSNDGVKFNLSFEVSKDTIRDLIAKTSPKPDNPLYGILYKWMLDFLVNQATQYVSSFSSPSYSSSSSSSSPSSTSDMPGTCFRYADYFNVDGTMKIDKVFHLYSECVSCAEGMTTKDGAKEEDAKEEDAKEENAKEEEATKEEEAKEEGTKENNSSSSCNQNLLADFVKLWSTCASTGTVEPFEVINLMTRTSEYLNADGEQVIEDTSKGINENNSPPFDN